MAFKRVTKKFTIDLSLPEDERWQHVISEDSKAAKALVRRVAKEMELVPRPVANAFAAAYKALGGRYTKEMQSWADGLDVTLGEMALIQSSYELQHASEYFASTRLYQGIEDALIKLDEIKTKFSKFKRRLTPLGCTAGIRSSKHGHMHHLRSMDWPLKGMAAATRILEFKQGKRRFITVGVTGMVGVLSGMLPGAYSVSINMAPPHRLPSMRRFGALFLLRETLEECDTYGAAVSRLASMPLAAGVFFVVCGAKPHQGCVIERTQTHAQIRKFSGVPLVHANHYESRRFQKFNASYEEEDEYEGSIFEDSSHRANALKERLAKLPRLSDLNEYATALSRSPVGNERTVHRMAFCPRSGEMAAWARMN
jgi:predicted choloylglycine hydrolase